ncbi:hypothetical protein [Aquiflexum sp.]|uniref:hypothetical protein n=1 Tax=Aquiflexum sp. TaxID=1872584 RepID=UPI0035943D1E
MNNLGEIYKSASAAFGLLPGIAILITNLGVPPDTSRYLFAGIVEAMGILTLLLLWTNKASIKKIRATKISKRAIISAVLFLLCLFLYLFLYGQYVVKVPHSDPLLFPFWPQGELYSGLIQHGSSYELIQNWGRDDVYKVIQSSSSASLQFTVLILLLVYVLVFVAITYAFGILGIKNRS